MAQRAGGYLHTVSVVDFRVSRGLGTPRAQRLEIFHLEAEAAQEELDVLRQGRVAHGQYEAVAACPVHIGRVVIEDALVQRVGQRSQRHRSTRVARAAVLDSVCSQNTHGVHSAGIKISPVRGIATLDHSLQFWGQLLVRHGENLTSLLETDIPLISLGGFGLAAPNYRNRVLSGRVAWLRLASVCSSSVDAWELFRARSRPLQRPITQTLV